MKGERTLKYRWIIFLILLAAYYLVYYQRNLPATLDTIIVDDLGQGIATLWAAVYFYVYAAFQLPIGLMTDKIGPRKILSTALVVITIGTFMISLADTFLILIIGKIVMSCGMACIYVPLTKIIVVWFMKKDFALLNGIVIAIGNFAGIMAAEPTRIILDMIGWRSVFITIGIITMILTVLCIMFVRNRPSDIGGREISEIYPEEKQANEACEKVSLKSGIKTVASGGRAFWMPAGMYFFIFGTMMLFQGRWIATYFNTIYDFAVAGTVMLTLLVIGKMVSTSLASTVAKKLGSKRKTVIAASIGYLCVWGAIWLLAGEVDVLIFWASISFMFGFFSGFASLSFAQAKEWFPAVISGTAIALLNTMVFLGGGIIQTISIWVINEQTKTLGEFTNMWMIAFICALIACIFAYLTVDNKTGALKKIKD
ncbi:MAG: MFS transporter [Methanomassiliicoccaceae archaeon]|nr:MFS transporter [Methanomassiliicoccaceae archaeon]